MAEKPFLEADSSRINTLNLPKSRPHRNVRTAQTMLGCSIQPNTQKQNEKGETIMSNSNSNKIMVPNAREAMNKFKMEAANDLAVSAPS